MLHWIKILALLVLTLLAMRMVSWIPLALLRKVLHWHGWQATLLCNTAALAAFLVFLRTQAVPGELLDPAAAVFGAVVYTSFLLLDLFLLKRAPKQHETL
jgi:hypothetical protein